ncbi:class F sortase [Nonomuraea sp. NPDC050556]|uniref:class F sortase n=1 Tax=Nonomuraea sp. NPDC050556 TaxID=3364369 RepID=UPI0037A45188
MKLGQLSILTVAGVVCVAGVGLIGYGVTGMLSSSPETPVVAERAEPSAPTLTDPPEVLVSRVAKPMKAVKPTAVYIPRIGVSAPLMELGLDAKGAIQNPPFSPANVAGWYRYGPVPGQRGAAVITGHLDTRSGPAVFAYLRNLRRGDQVQVLRADRSVAIFVVDRVEHTQKATFPTSKVYGKVAYPGLRVITCGGAFDSKAHSYKENTIVYAHLAYGYHPKT